MQVQNITGVNFSSGRLTPEALEARAQALEDGDFDIEKQINPELIADVLDGKLKKTETGRKAVNTIASVAGFTAAVLSFRRVAPKVRHGIAAATGKIAGKISGVDSRIKNDTMSELGQDMVENAGKLASKGDGSLLQRGINRVFGKKSESVTKGLKAVGIETGGDAADTAIAVGAAALAGREVGDIADGEQKEATLKGTLKDIAKVAGELGVADLLPGA